MSAASPPVNHSAPPRSGVWLVAVFLLPLALAAWAYADVLHELFLNWQNSPDYSGGMIVLPAAAFIIWTRRKSLRLQKLRPSLWGVALLVAAQGVRLVGVLYLYESLERYAFVLTLWGIVLLLGGINFTWRMRWVLLFLLLMVPLPGRVHNLIAPPLQEIATAGTVVLLELAGVATTRQGNVLMLNQDVAIGVVEACSGLRMLTAFVIVAALVCFMIDRPAWQKVAVMLSSIPIAIICNLARLLITAALYLYFDSSIAETFFHDFAGLLMMPLAIVLILGLLRLLNLLVVAEPVAPGTPARTA